MSRKVTYKTGDRIHPSTKLTFMLELPQRKTPSGQFQRVALFLCECGNLTESTIPNAKSGRSRSCGCTRISTLVDMLTTHGLSNHSLYKTWTNMLSRCNNPDAPDYEWYGGRGIDVCDEWRGPNGLASFISDMGERPTGASLDRADNSMGYYPSNCRWVDQSTQTFNQRMKRNNTSGHRGVSWSSITSKWYAQMVYHGTTIWGGHFDRLEDAVLKRRELELQYRGYAINEEGVVTIKQEAKES